MGGIHQEESLEEQGGQEGAGQQAGQAGQHIQHSGLLSLVCRCGVCDLVKRSWSGSREGRRARSVICTL